jgi:predicted DsbA family dithiol-disulfide isomerase
MSDTQAAPVVQVYADYVCPFCYLGYASFDRYREEREGRSASDPRAGSEATREERDEPLEADWHPFDLRAGKRDETGEIDQSVDDGKGESYYEEARKNVRRLAERYDVEMAQKLSRDVNSYDAQRVAWRAREEHPDAFETFHRSVFDALWEEGRDIGDRDVIAELAADAGLPEGYVDDVFADDASAEELEAARERGVTGVPAFVAGERAARGAVPPEQLRRLVEGT